MNMAPKAKENPTFKTHARALNKKQHEQYISVKLKEKYKYSGAKRVSIG